MATPIQIALDLIENEVVPRLTRHGIRIEDSPISSEVIAGLAIYKHVGQLDTHSIRQILDRYFDTAG